MCHLSLQQCSKEQLAEMSLIELAYDLLVEKNEPIFFNDLVAEMAALKGVSKEELAAKIAQFYTDLNVDGRFTSLGENRWGLKIWYPVDQVEEEVVHTDKPKKKKKSKKAAAAVVDGFDELDDEELEFDEDLEDLAEDLDDSEDDDLLDDDDDLDDDLLDDVDEEDDLDEDLLKDEEFELDEEDEEEEEEELFEDEEDKK
ncbi:DNA-directed RNA polymerase subunit delta [Peribacillus asahii]|uniref:DNA-directed RNA polymerase subunit delta n=1 Tax=Peribacillus asahii TaxID=228899 RepID=UPI0027D7F38E|nr:DNA-directed RNA polymerase subunit delta [Peribacillus asahii]